MNDTIQSSVKDPVVSLKDSHYQLREYYVGSDGKRFHTVQCFLQRPSKELIKSALARYEVVCSVAELQTLSCGAPKPTKYPGGYWRLIAVSGPCVRIPSDLRGLRGECEDFHTEVRKLKRPYFKISEQTHNELIAAEFDYYLTKSGLVVTFGGADDGFALMPLDDVSAETIKCANGFEAR